MAFGTAVLVVVWLYCGLYTSSFYSYDYEQHHHKDPAGVFVILQILLWPVFALLLFVRSLQQ